MTLLARWLLVVSVCASAFSYCVAEAPVQYTVAIDAPHTHYLQVEAKIVPKQQAMSSCSCRSGHPGRTWCANTRGK